MYSAQFNGDILSGSEPPISRQIILPVSILDTNPTLTGSATRTWMDVRRVVLWRVSRACNGMYNSCWIAKMVDSMNRVYLDDQIFSFNGFDSVRRWVFDGNRIHGDLEPQLTSFRITFRDISVNTVVTSSVSVNILSLTIGTCFIRTNMFKDQKICSYQDSPSENIMG